MAKNGERHSVQQSIQDKSWAYEQLYVAKKPGINHSVTLIRLNWSHFTSLVLLFALHIYHFAPATPNSLLPCHSVCFDVHFNCIHHFKSICLPWQQELTYTRKPVQELTKFNPILYGQRATS